MSTMLWRFYQRTHDKKEPWQAIAEKQAGSVEATHMTMLATDSPENTEDSTKVRYFGDMVIDIDHPPEMLEEAIDSANRVVDFLSSRCDVDYLQVYASGKKGFHILIPWEFMLASKRALPGLNLKYKAIAQRIIVETGATGFDMSLYAGKKGHMVRVANRQREDGRYKVPVTIHELRTMTPESYMELTKAPRNLTFDRPNSPDLRMVSLYQEAKILAPSTADLSVPDEILSQFGDDNHPECVKRLVAGKELKQDANFNKKAMQFAIYLRSVAGLTKDGKDRLSEQFINNNPSSMYKTTEERKNNLASAINGLGNARFSCAGMKSILNPEGLCKGCSVLQGRPSEVPSADNNYGIEEDPNGYYVTNSEGVRKQLLNFTISIDRILTHSEHEGEANAVWERATFSPCRNGKPLTKFTADRDCLETVERFKSIFNLVRAARIDISQRELDRLRLYIHEVHKEIPSMIPSSKFGVQLIKFSQPNTPVPLLNRTWVEEGYSLDELRMLDTVSLTRLNPPRNAVKWNNRPIPSKATKEIEEALNLLFNSSRPDVIGRILGWVCACHLKPHVIEKNQSFPLLHIVGPSQSGKTSLAVVSSALGCADYRQRPDLADSITNWPLKEIVSETTSIPRILDEVSRGKIHASKWVHIRACLKASYQQGTLSTGSLDNSGSKRGVSGIKATSVTATSPMLILGTTPLDEAELWNRLVEVEITSKIHEEEGGRYRENYEELRSNPYTHWERLFDFGFQMVERAIGMELTLDEVWRRYQIAYERAKPMKAAHIVLGYSYIYFGLDFLVDTLKVLGYSESLIKQAENIQKITEEWIEFTRPSIIMAKERTEIDVFIENLGAFSNLEKAGNKLVRPGVHYVRKGQVLYIDLTAAFYAHHLGCQMMGRHTEFENPRTLTKALVSSKFYLGIESVALGAITSAKPWFKVDLNKVAERGNDISNFEED